MQRTSSILQGIFTKMPTKINSKALINNMQLTIQRDGRWAKCSAIHLYPSFPMINQTEFDNIRRSWVSDN